MSLKERISANLLSQYALRALAIVFGFVLIPFLTRKLGTEAFGVIVFFESLVLSSEAALSCLRSAVSRHATVAWSQGKTKDFERYLTTARVLFIVLAGVLLGIGLWFAVSMPPWLHVPASLKDSAQALFAFFVISFVLMVPNDVYRAGLYSKQRFDRLNFALSTALVFRAVVILILFSWVPSHWLSLSLYGLVHLGTTWIKITAIRFEFDKQFPGLRKTLRGFDFISARNIFSFGSYSFLAHFASIFHDGLMIFLVNGYGGPKAAAMFAVGSKIPDALYSTFKEPAWALEPTVTTLAAGGERTRIHELVFLYTKSSTLFIAAICVWAFLFSKDLLQVWVGDQFSAAAGVMIWSFAGLFFYLPFAVCESLLPAYGEVRRPAILGSIFTPLSLGLAYALAVGWQWGITGFTAGVAITWSVYAMIVTVPLACRLSGLPIRMYLWSGFLKPVLLSASFMGAYASCLLFNRLPAISFYAVLVALPFVVAYIVCAWLFILNQREREIFLTTLKKRKA